MARTSTPTEPRSLVSIQAAAEYLGCSPLTVRRMISRGEIAGFRIGTGQRAPIRVDLAQIENEVLHSIPAAGGDK